MPVEQDEERIRRLPRPRSTAPKPGLPRRANDQAERRRRAAAGAARARRSSGPPRDGRTAAPAPRENGRSRSRSSRRGCGSAAPPEDAIDALDRLRGIILEHPRIVGFGGVERRRRRWRDCGSPTAHRQQTAVPTATPAHRQIRSCPARRATTNAATAAPPIKNRAARLRQQQQSGRRADSKIGEPARAAAPHRPHQRTTRGSHHAR